jgi:putative nucleotidyltransferase with HDIG domain
MRVKITPYELKQLAPMSLTISRLTKSMQDINSKMSEITRLIELDTALTANVLRWANSAYYGARMPIESVQAAVIRLGMNNIIRLSISHSLSTVLKKSVPGYALAENQLWRHNVAAALTVETIGQITNHTLHPAAFTAALLHDVGKIVLGQHLDAGTFQQLRNMVEDDHMSYVEAERTLLETDHAIVGAALAGYWKFPDELVYAIERHHDPEPQPDNLLDLVIIANTLAKEIGLGAGSEPIRPSVEKVMLRQGLNAESRAQLCDRVKEKMVKTEEEWNLL